MGRRGWFVTTLVTKAVVALVAASVLAVSGYGWSVLSDLSGRMVMSDVLSPDADGDRPRDRTRDILLVGADSRVDAQGNPLTRAERRMLWVDKDDGEVNTDTIILVHIPVDTSKAVAISIPRDSYVDIPGFGTHKINSAYPRGKAVERRKQKANGVKTSSTIERRSNDAGAKLLVRTVEKLTGRTIDEYASVNLLGFYDIVNAVGGVEVCLKEATKDDKTNSRFPAGKQTISGRKAVAFVRQRVGLPRGDLDRVVRQQVFLNGMTRKLLSAGTLSSPSRMEDLITAISRSVVLSKGWDIIAFAERMSSLAGGQVQFRTIPVGSLALPTPGDGTAVEVDPARVRQFIAALSESRDRPSGPSVRPQAGTSTPSSTPPSDRNGSASGGTSGTQSKAPSTGSSSPPSDREPPITADEVPCVN